MDLGNGTYQTFGYDTDPRYRLNDINYAYRCNTGDPITLNGGLDLTRDNVGNPLTWGDNLGNYTRGYTYDLNSRLGTESYPDIARSPIHTIGLGTKRVSLEVRIMQWISSQREPDIHTSTIMPET